MKELMVIAIVGITFVFGYGTGKERADKWYAVHPTVFPAVHVLDIEPCNGVKDEDITLKDVEISIPVLTVRPNGDSEIDATPKK